MEPQTSKSISKRKFFVITFCIIAIIGIITFIFLQQKKPVSQDFFDTYAVSDTFAKNIVNSSVFDFNSLFTAVHNNDLQTGVHLLSQGVADNQRNSARMTILTAQIAKLKLTTAHVSDSLANTKIQKLFDLIDQRQTNLGTYLPLQGQLLVALKQYYIGQATGQSGQQLSSNVDTVIQSMQKTAMEINTIQGQIDGAFADLSDYAGYKNTNLINVETSLTTGTNGPTDVPAFALTDDFPTPIPEPLGPQFVASDSANISTSSASTATGSAN